MNCVLQTTAWGRSVPLIDVAYMSPASRLTLCRFQTSQALLQIEPITQQDSLPLIKDLTKSSLKNEAQPQALASSVDHSRRPDRRYSDPIKSLTDPDLIPRRLISTVRIGWDPIDINRAPKFKCQIPKQTD